MKAFVAIIMETLMEAWVDQWFENILEPWMHYVLKPWMDRMIHSAQWTDGPWSCSPWALGPWAYGQWTHGLLGHGPWVVGHGCRRPSVHGPWAHGSWAHRHRTFQELCSGFARIRRACCDLAERVRTTAVPTPFPNEPGARGGNVRVSWDCWLSFFGPWADFLATVVRFCLKCGHILSELRVTFPGTVGYCSWGCRLISW